MLRFHLPPNFAAAAARNAIPLKVEIKLEGSAAAPELLPALALLQRWCGPKPPAFVQLTRAQLRELVGVVGDESIFVENGRPGPFQHDKLLAEQPATPGPAPQTPAAGPTQTSKSKAQRYPGFTPLVVDGSEHFLALTLPSPEHPQYDTALALVKQYGFTLEPSNRRWWLRDRHKTLNFLAAHLARLRDDFGAQFTPNFEHNTANLRAAEIASDIADHNGGAFTVTVGLRAGSADESAVRAAVATNRGYVEADGKIYLVETAQLQKLTAAQRALAGDPHAPLTPRRAQQLSGARIAEVQELLEQLSPDFQAPEEWRRRSSVLRNLTKLEPAPLPAALQGSLRPYQKLGVAWLWHLHRHDLGGVLADEMGLGKTLEALGLLSAIATLPAPRPPCLVVAPASLLENWRREAARFAPYLRVFVHHAENRLATARAAGAFDLIVTSYGTLTRDQALFTERPFLCVIADEAQHIKNRRSQNAAALRALSATSRFLLTGTPLENSLDDLRSLFEVILPGYLTKVPAGLRGDERAWFDERLRAQTAPYILRRTKQAVAPELPAKLEQVVWCELTASQGALYRKTQESSERELIDLQAGGASEQKLKFAALTQLLRLRQICCDPRLVAPESTADMSAKLDSFGELLAEAIDDGHRVLVFSQFTSLLALVRVELEAQALAHCYLDGSMTPRARQAEVDRFQASPEIPLFLLSLKAGGTGLNLTGADTVVHFDPWWNPAAEAQATDRAHRIGQTRVVTSYKLIASGTVEEKVLALQAEKRVLLAGVFEASDEIASQLSLSDLTALMR
jgi:superfamily II DNA or RNA helicase